MCASPAYEEFRKSMNISYDQWREGEPYDMDAFAQMSADEREVIVKELLGKGQPDWRDMDVLVIGNTKEAFDHLRGFLTIHHTVQRRAWALRAVMSMEGRMHGSTPDAQLSHLIEDVTSDDGLTETLMIADEHAGAMSKLRLLQGVRDRPDVAVNFASHLLDMYGLSKDMAAFDPKFRPTLLKLLGDESDETRMAAFAKVCEWLGIDAATVPAEDDQQPRAWAEKTWPRV